MNSAQIAYAQPEIRGEPVVPYFTRFLKGLNLTKFQIIPHYEVIKNKKFNGLRIIEDISYGDNKGKCFYVLPNGNYIYQTKNEVYLYDEAYNKNKFKLY